MKMISSSIHFHANDIVSFIFLYGWIVLHCVYIPHFIGLPWKKWSLSLSISLKGSWSHDWKQWEFWRRLEGLQGETLGHSKGKTFLSVWSSLRLGPGDLKSRHTQVIVCGWRPSVLLHCHRIVKPSRAVRAQAGQGGALPGTTQLVVSMHCGL
jgi:hypothetical protein